MLFSDISTCWWPVDQYRREGDLVLKDVWFLPFARSELDEVEWGDKKVRVSEMCQEVLLTINGNLCEKSSSIFWWCHSKWKLYFSHNFGITGGPSHFKNLDTRNPHIINCRSSDHLKVKVKIRNNIKSTITSHQSPTKYFSKKKTKINHTQTNKK